MDYYTLKKFLLVLILLVLIDITRYYYPKYMSKQKNIFNIKMYKNNE